MTPSSERHEVLVVGVGGIGSAATYHLARRGVDVLGIERFDVPHGRGSSGGRTRLLQLLTDVDPTTMALAEAAHDHWRRLEDTAGSELLVETGSLAVAPEGEDPVASARRASERHDLDHELLTGAALSERFPGYDFPDEYSALYQPDGAVLAPERGIVAHTAAAIDHGATVRARERVVDWTTTDDGVCVETDRDTYAAERLVVAAGAWAAQTVDALEGLLEPCRHATAWFAPSGGGHDTGAAVDTDRLPGFVATVDGDNYYGVPGVDLPGMKLGRNDFSPTEPDALAGPAQTDERPLRAFARQYVPGAAGTTLRLTTGLVTNSPDGRFVIDTLPGDERVALAAGLSGRGYKFAPVIGEILADLALDGETDHDIDNYAIGRFENA